jgi:hypothetical protein
MAKHLFEKGNKGGGRKKLPEDVKKAFADATPEAIEILIELMKHSKDDNIRLKAAVEVMNRHLGKPVQPIGNEDNEPFLVKWKE